MFKAQVLRRNFSLFNRVPTSRIIRSAARDGHQSVIIQRYRIHQPFLTRSRLVGTVFVGAALYGLTRYVGIEVEVRTEEDEKHGTDGADGEEQDEDGEDDEDYDDALLFLPTGLSRPMPPTYYKGSDPEWQEFRKLAADRQRLERIRTELTLIVRTWAANYPFYVNRIGKIDQSKGQVWIEFRFPDGPPIEFERPGIELTEDLQWRKASRPVEPRDHDRLNRILYPTEVSKALYQDTKRKMNQSLNNFLASTGWSEKPQQETVHTMMEKMQNLSINPPPPSSPANPPSSNSPSSPNATAADSKQPPDNPSPLGTPAKDLGITLPNTKELTLDLTQFRQDFRKASKPYPPDIPRGAFRVNGLIQVYGERARVTVNVVAIYDPQQGRFVQLNTSLWNFVEYQQRPRGGA